MLSVLYTPHSRGIPSQALARRAGLSGEVLSKISFIFQEEQTQSKVILILDFSPLFLGKFYSHRKHPTRGCIIRALCTVGPSLLSKNTRALLGRAGLLT